MPKNFTYDAIVVGSGPNGLAAAIRLAQERWSVLLLEAKETIGGGLRSKELTLPGYVHDVCSAIHPLGISSPFFRTLSLEKYGLHWIHPEFPLAHPLDDGAAILKRSVGDTAASLGPDNQAYEQLLGPLVRDAENLTPEILQPVLHIPRHPIQLSRFGLAGIKSSAALANKQFTGAPARALLAGLSAHSFLPLNVRLTAGIGLFLGMLGHSAGWPLPRGGSQKFADALGACFRALGGEIVAHTPVSHLDELPMARIVLLDVTPRQLLAIAGDKLPVSYRRRLDQYRYGPGVFKIDYALAQPIPWKTEACRHAGTVHVGGSFEQIANSERAASQGEHSEQPFVLLAQPTLFDPSRAPSEKHTAWAYCHVPNGSILNMTDRMENQIERFAPGFRDCIVARHTMNCVQMEHSNPNLVGGDINGGLGDLRQTISRPILSLKPYRTPVPGLYLCSSSTPPGGGVHGMCGFHAAETAIRDVARTTGRSTRQPA
jgi:phytoene dehydrogenase-like protein